MTGGSAEHGDRVGQPGWIFTTCKKIVSSRPFGRCHDCGGRFRRAAKSDYLCDRCDTIYGKRLLDRTGEFDRLCDGCIEDLGLRDGQPVPDGGASIARSEDPTKAVLSASSLWTKYLQDYVVNVATGCTHGCRFCYVPATPNIRARGDMLAEEEAAEFIVASKHVERERESLDAVVDELADLRIMQEQLTEFIGRDRIEVVCVSDQQDAGTSQWEKYKPSWESIKWMWDRYTGRGKPCSKKKLTTEPPTSDSNRRTSTGSAGSASTGAARSSVTRPLSASCTRALFTLRGATTSRLTNFLSWSSTAVMDGLMWAWTQTRPHEGLHRVQGTDRGEDSRRSRTGRSWVGVRERGCPDSDSGTDRGLRADGAGTYQIGGHQIELNNSYNIYGSVSSFRCVNDGCWIESSGEFGARERIEELAEEFGCPSGTSSCIKCGDEILPVADICRECERGLESSVKIRPGDSGGLENDE